MTDKGALLMWQWLGLTGVAGIAFSPENRATLQNGERPSMRARNHQ
ncbi:hypothetical protein HFN60_13950 [Rhizobium leguminosarum]|nr:hypothetical protein [Rhizobium leguminosarum]MBY5816736.1 hypothetical protein [Rhizobium leguminosarum]